MGHPLSVAAAPGIVLLSLWAAVSTWKALSIWRKRTAGSRRRPA
jgi:hypothetical protein